MKEKISMFCHVEPEQVCTSILYVGKYTNISVHFSFQVLTASFTCDCFYNFYLTIMDAIAFSKYQKYIC